MVENEIKDIRNCLKIGGLAKTEEDVNWIVDHLKTIDERSDYTKKRSIDFQVTRSH